MRVTPHAAASHLLNHASVVYGRRYKHSILSPTVGYDLLILSVCRCRLGQALAVAGKNPSATTGVPTVNLGVSKLPLTVKTDLANR